MVDYQIQTIDFSDSTTEYTIELTGTGDLNTFRVDFDWSGMTGTLDGEVHLQTTGYYTGGSPKWATVPLTPSSSVTNGTFLIDSATSIDGEDEMVSLVVEDCTMKARLVILKKNLTAGILNINGCNNG